MLYAWIQKKSVLECFLCGHRLSSFSFRFKDHGKEEGETICRVEVVDIFFTDLCDGFVSDSGQGSKITSLHD